MIASKIQDNTIFVGSLFNSNFISINRVNREENYISIKVDSKEYNFYPKRITLDKAFSKIVSKFFLHRKKLISFLVTNFNIQEA